MTTETENESKIPNGTQVCIVGNKHEGKTGIVVGYGEYIVKIDNPDGTENLVGVKEEDLKVVEVNEIDSKEEFIQSLEERKDKKSKPGWSDYINRIPGAQYISTKYQDWGSNTENEEPAVQYYAKSRVERELPIFEQPQYPEDIKDKETIIFHKVAKCYQTEIGAPDPSNTVEYNGQNINFYKLANRNGWICDFDPTTSEGKLFTLGFKKKENGNPISKTKTKKERKNDVWDYQIMGSFFQYPHSISSDENDVWGDLDSN
jgi:hypothetical protein